MVNTSNGAVAQKIEYSEFGEVLIDTNPGFQPFGFAGGLYDNDTKLVRFGARDYDSFTGRWTCKDPIDFEGGDTNLFAYCMNDPVNFLDPDGMDYTPASNFAWNSFILNMPFSSGVSRIPYVVGPGAGVISNPCPGVKSTGLDILNYLANKKEEITWRDNSGEDGSRSRIRKIKDALGRTLEVWHEVFDRAGKIIHRDWKGPGKNPYIKPNKR